MAEMTKLPKTQYSGLETSNLMEDIYNLVKENPDYNSNWEDFLNSNAGRMLVQTFAWIADQLTTRIDWVVNENFIGTATQRESIIKLLKLIGYKLSLPSAAEVPVLVTLSQAIQSDYILTPSYVAGSATINPKKINGIDQSGEIRNFEALSYEDGKYAYKVPVTFSTTDGLSKTINFYEGTTKIKTFTATSSEGQEFTISDPSVIRDSIAVYLLEVVGGIAQETELLQVDSFLDYNAQRSTDSSGNIIPLPYVVNVNDDNSVIIEFAPTALLPYSERLLPNGSELIVFYRVGGGLDSNISRKSINFTEKVTIVDDEITVTYYNDTEGVGGEDAETIEHASEYGPLQIRTAGKAVTEEDYDTILSNLTYVLTSKSYGYHNIPSDYYQNYGVYFNPMDVVNYVVLKKPGWETRPTNKYYLSNWGTFNLENRFNGKYFFNDGSFGNQMTLKKAITYSAIYDYDNVGGREFKNYVILNTNDTWKQSIFKEVDGVQVPNEDLIASLTTVQYNPLVHNKLASITGHVITDPTGDNYLYGSYEETNFPRISISESIHAYLQSNKNVATGINFNNGHLFSVSIDGRPDVIVDMSYGGLYNESNNIIPLDTDGGNIGIIDIINEALGDGNVVTYAYQDFGILIPDTSAQVPNLENEDEETWYLRISDINYEVNTGTNQSYTAMLANINTAINGAGYEATFVQSHVNITCYDIRISRTSAGGTVVLEDSNYPQDILVAFEAIPITTLPIGAGSFDTVASKVVTASGSYVKLTSPNTGNASVITLTPGLTDNALNELFGLNHVTDEVTEYTCYGTRTITVIYRDTSEEDFGDIIYEHGSCVFNATDPMYVYLNYIKSHSDVIHLGTYFYEEFSDTEPEWKPIDTRIYNALYTVDDTDPSGRTEYFDLDNSNILLRFTRNESSSNSIYTITNDYALTRATQTSITTRVLGATWAGTGNVLSVSINGHAAINTTLSSGASMATIVSTLNSSCNTQANESLGGSLSFATLNGNGSITFRIDNIKNGSIRFIDAVGNVNTSLFGEGHTGDWVVYPNGDYYLTLNPTNDNIDMVMINGGLNMPDTPFYIHYIADRSHVFLDPLVEKIHTDEDDLIDYMYPYKIAGVRNIFRNPIFSTFDFEAEVYCYKSIPVDQIKSNIETKIKNDYGITNAKFNIPIIKSEIVKKIMDVSGVRYVDVNFFGKDLENNTSAENRITPEFDEIIVLSDNEFNSSGTQIHGLKLSYIVV